MRRPDAWDPPDQPPTSASITSACTHATALGPVSHTLTQACKDKCELASECAGAPRHRAGRLVLCMEHAHAAARAVRGGYGGVLCMRVKHAACLRGADMAPRRGDFASIAPASRCLPACADGNAVHLGHEDMRPKLLRHARVENSLPHWPAQVFGEPCAMRGDTV